ncbi:Structure-specific endonuclease subunit SLX4 [Pleurostoma richardsiae]|uniref:Structure-specific endonuclease subunit SLX4 n=1 Tax=Pleurostoma richardsiae TaxID=41990 RepID=A0AA38RGH6_9PEZI|nr:Structure-specific endonuclease subunit SLX4 [Pleurostoma richardsiae]
MASGGILLSSPPRPPLLDQFATMSSSPDLPSLTDIVGKRQPRPPLRSGSKAIPIPEDAVPSFRSAASFWLAAQAEANDMDHVFAEEAPKPALKTNGWKPPAPKTVIEVSPDASRTATDPLSGSIADATKDRDSGFSRGKTLEEEVDEILSVDVSPNSKPWKKYKSPKRVTDDQSTISITKVTKLVAKTTYRKPKEETVSRHFTPEPPACKERTRTATPELVELEPALQRRADWTPPRPDTINLLSDSSEVRQSPSKNVFKNLQDSYGCKEPSKEPAMTTTGEPSNVLGKRKLIEPVMIGSGSTSGRTSSREASPVKTKALKKKPRTITELATAAYAVRETIESSGDGGSSRSDSLLKYFGADVGSNQTPSDTASTAPKKRGGKAKKATAKKAAPQHILLSPTSAMRESAVQDFVFGTSSQLVREQSPTLLRDLQMAIEASMTVDDDDAFASSPAGELVARTRNYSNLWSVAARDADGQLLEVEVIDLVHSPVTTQPDAILNPWKDLPPGEVGTKAPAGDTPNAPSSQDSLGFPLTKSNFFSTQRQSAATDEKEPVIGPRQAAISPANTAPKVVLDDEPPPSNQEEYMEQQQQQQQQERSTQVEVPRPKYELYTDVQLAKEISSYGFKAVKKRTAMIALLDRCWASKRLGPTIAGVATTATLSSSAPTSASRTKTPASNTGAAAAVKNPRGRPRKISGSTAAVSASAPAATTEAAKKPRGRPRKDSAIATKAAVSSKPKSATGAAVPKPKAVTLPPAPTTPKRKKAATQQVIEIADTDTEEGLLSPSPSLSSPERIFSSPSGVDLSGDGDTELTLNTSPTSQQSALFGYITAAVTSAPRTKDPAEPSWHEKMLMYDPIVLEDLAAWLNSGQLTRVGCADEVSPEDVKRWCESKSVCCLWRATMNGKERKRF